MDYSAAMKLAKTNVELFDAFVSSAKGTPVAPLLELVSKVQHSALEGFESIASAVAATPTAAATAKSAKPLKATGDVMKKAFDAQADMLVNAGTETVAATAKAKEAVKKATKSAKKGDMAALVEDLTAVSGVGPSTMKKLHGAGVRTIEDLAKTSKKDLEVIIEESNIRMLKNTPADWIKDAKSLMKAAKAK